MSGGTPWAAGNSRNIAPSAISRRLPSRVAQSVWRLPSTRASSSKSMPARRLHYDLRLELDGVFKSWAVTRGPSARSGRQTAGCGGRGSSLWRTADFEGTIPGGQYGGGTVQLWDRGFWAPEGGKSAQQMLAAGDLKFTMEGERLHGSWVLVRMKGDRFRGNRTNWLLIKHRDDFAKPGDHDTLLAEDRSVASGRPMAQIAAGKGRAPKPFMLAKGKGAGADAVWNSNREASGGEQGGDGADEGSAQRRKAGANQGTGGVGRGSARAARGGGASVLGNDGSADDKDASSRAAKTTVSKGPRGRKAGKASGVSMPSFIPPQLALLVERPPAGAGWAHEIKLDGYRLQLHVRAGHAVLKTRKGLDWTAKFESIATAAAGLPDCILDGEAVALNSQGAPDFSALQAALSEGRGDALVFFVFDLLFEEGEGLAEPAADGAQTPPRGDVEFSAAGGCPLTSGISSISRPRVMRSCNRPAGFHSKASSPSSSMRPIAPVARGSWMKSKCRAGHEVVIGGWTSEGRELRSLIAGVYKDAPPRTGGAHRYGFNSSNVKVANGTTEEAGERRESVRGAAEVTDRPTRELGEAGAGGGNRIRRLDRRRQHPAGCVQRDCARTSRRRKCGRRFRSRRMRQCC